MIRLAIHANAAIARSLNAIATACGATVDDTAEYSLHHIDDHFAWRHGDTVLQQVPCPARPEALARMLTSQPLPPQTLDAGWRFDSTARQLIHEGDQQALTEKESLLLSALLASYPSSAGREALLSSVWGMQADVETHTLETHIYRLRAKLAAIEPKPCDIITVDGAYQLQLGRLA